jgi:hypothetical protein
MKPWIKAHVNKKDIAPKVRPEVYGKSFLKWWTSLQPNWRKMVDGTLGNDTPDDEKWGGLMKGGTSGIYTVVIALSWWIKALGTFTCGGDASVTIRDVTWVLEQVCDTWVSDVGSSGLKRGHDDSSEETPKKKRCIFMSFFLYFGIKIIL